MRAELDVTPEIELTPKTAFKLSYAHHIACAHMGKEQSFEKARAVIETALRRGVISKEESEEFFADALEERSKYMERKFKDSDDATSIHEAKEKAVESLRKELRDVRHQHENAKDALSKKGDEVRSLRARVAELEKAQEKAKEPALAE